MSEHFLGSNKGFDFFANFGQDPLLMMIFFSLVDGKNCSWQLHEGHDGRFDGLGSKIGPKLPPKYHWKALIKGF
jgi:hypothetical protein